MKLVRREFLRLTSTMVMASAASQSSEIVAGPSSTEILHSDLIGQHQKVAQTRSQLSLSRPARSQHGTSIQADRNSCLDCRES